MADVIVAASSPPGRSARSVVRASGPTLRPLLASLLDRAPSPRTLTTARLSLRTTASADASLPVLASFFPAPASFTGEDVLEIQSPGHPALVDRLLRTVREAAEAAALPSRLAEPGEFTQRAYLAGKVDLTRAEGLAATVSAESDAQLHAARLLRGGRLGRWAEGLVDRLGQSLALVEAGIDFTDQEDVVPITPSQLDRALADAEASLRSLFHRSRAWSSVEGLPWVVLVGRPNTGKSTLLNALTGRWRAVTSGWAGTTRDVLTEPLRLSGPAGDIELLLADVAGLDRPTGPLEAATQEAARDAIDRAELLLLVDDTDDSPPLDPLRRDGDRPPSLAVRTKADVRPPSRRDGRIAVNSVDGAGLDRLRAALADRLRSRSVSVQAELLALHTRHRDELTAALEALRSARTLLADGTAPEPLGPQELIADRMREALDRLAALGGRMSPDDVIGKVFATFCVGK